MRNESLLAGTVLKLDKLSRGAQIRVEQTAMTICSAGRQITGCGNAHLALGFRQQSKRSLNSLFQARYNQMVSH